MATTAKNLRLDDDQWRAALWLAHREGTNGTEKVRDLLDDWLTSEAAADPEVRRQLDAFGYRPARRRNPGGRPAGRRRTLAAAVADEEGPRADGTDDGRSLLSERYGPRPLHYTPPAGRRTA